MAPMTASTSTSLETPSKKAAASFDQMSLKTPTKSASLMDKLNAARDEDKEEQVEEPVEEYRTRFVGDVDLDEKDEPLLKPSPRRFVLFPIQYHEVCRTVL